VDMAIATELNSPGQRFILFRSIVKSVSNSLPVLEQHLLAAAIIEFRGPAVGVVGHPLSGFRVRDFSN